MAPLEEKQRQSFADSVCMILMSRGINSITKLAARKLKYLIFAISLKKLKGNNKKVR